MAVLYVVAWVTFCTGCDIIRNEDRLIPISGNFMSGKKVLLVEFTDQNCKNCLYATAEIETLSDRFSDKIVVVSIHANPLPYPLRTGEGNEYERHFKAEDHPAGIVDGGAGKYMSHDPQLWGGFVFERLKKEPAVQIDMDASFDEVKKEVSIRVQLKGNTALSDAKLQLWLIENNIKQWQLMLDGTRNDNYMHNHVFRTSVNGTWGESFSIGSGENKEFQYVHTLNQTWKPEDIAIIGFAFNPATDEVYNVQEFLLTKR